MSSSRSSTTATGSTADCRWASLRSRVKFVGIKVSSTDIPLSLLCLAFGPLVYAAWLGTVGAMLVLACVALIVSRHEGLPIVARSVRALVIVVPLLAWMLASATWSLDGEASAVVTLRVAVLLSGGFGRVTSFALLPLDRLRLPLIASALGLSVASAVVACDLALGGHLALFLHGPRPDGIDPALAYGRPATLNAILMVPVLVGLLRLGA